MHELSLARGLVALAEDEARKAGAKRVTRLRLAVGALGHVTPEAMRFCFDAAASGSMVEGAALAIDIVPGAGRCRDCGRTVALAARFDPCPACGGFVRMTAGDELRLTELEVE